MTEQEFVIALNKLGINVTKEQLTKLDKFYSLLIEWNNKINLTRITDKEDVYLKHFYDSLTIKKVIDLSKVKTLCDVGTGAGFPGIVLKIIYPNLKVTLIDSLNKRVTYLNEIIKELNLDNVVAIHTRGEEHHEKYQVVVSRAVAKTEKLVKYTMHLLDKDGVMIAMKGDIDKELDEKTINRLKSKYKIIKIEKFTLPKEESKRSLLVLQNK